MTARVGGIPGGIDAVSVSHNSYKSYAYEVDRDFLPLRQQVPN